MKILDLVSKGIVIGDGAIGTLLHSHGLQSSFEELNLSDPDLIISIHKQYVAAGADIIQTNTYGANEAKLRMYGLENQVTQINKAAVKLAKAAVTDKNAILGTIGGMKHIGAVTTTDMEREFMLLEQAGALLEEKVDGLLLETFYDEFELLHAVKVLRKQTDIPIIAQLALHEAGTTQNGNDVNGILTQLLDYGANIVGLNCQLGPLHMTEAFKMISIPKNGYLSAYPNAGLPNYVEGRYVYEGSPAYFEEMTPKFIEQGIRLLGGCCGTTPAHIEGMKRVVANVTPVTEKQIVQRQQQVVHIQTKRASTHVTLAEKARKQTTVVVELDPPKTLDTQRFFEGARALKRAGADAITLADNSLASPRISNMAMGALLTKHDIPVLTHLTCRDHNVIGLQSHLLGLSALGMEEVLALTGDPARVGDFPGATSVYDLSSIELIKMIKEMNDGRSILGKSIGSATRFSVGGAFNPHVRHLKAAVKRMERKIAAGAEYFLTQPIYDVALIEEIYEATKHLEKPIFIGIMPLVSKRNADFLHFEVPGITLPEEVRQRMDGHETQESAIEEGIRISQELINEAMKYFNGIYLITPFLKYEITENLVKYVKEKQEVKEGIN
ncbi:bifunctional homocysteine S-methyltransferase/methylenetetrahydrofolate reductase [Bacillus pseudomycoides]|uniref:bifunctional homocysteine S-methyltransferase/methylenetetrahydrofolate reductase n=1 Tax=Bacillus pseudomycoides TaxID=64104 RepID=UPI000BEDA2DC|nr:bifunctional homocysteine S-methyltransferase/methylenetetrahydrofolate reductase [Bacillus pseudomycoides]PEE41811.1 bifunctional homocysteine S-methyltransferase/methylenetetrahydrofolate reductase [Bacillus pseudomycoides]PGA91664.1 bifunctional homocysteine S-methyltransferase/methylenetetrahydrofolate reductase [Bacillus pseudomycoides]PHF42424.1 bifunctional homocysteine S-methyltransferase/methylenetetrahydrofolate reductase [Bacillus pseudomycoides]